MARPPAIPPKQSSHSRARAAATAADLRWMTPAHESRDVSAAEQIVHHVRRLLEQGELSLGDKLPAERALAQQTGVSRSSVRVGLRALSAMGVSSRATARARSSPTARPPSRASRCSSSRRCTA